MFWSWKLVTKKVCEKHGKQLNVGTGITSVKRKFQAFAIAKKTASESKVASVRMMKKKNWIILQIMDK